MIFREVGGEGSGWGEEVGGWGKDEKGKEVTGKGGREVRIFGLRRGWRHVGTWL